MARPKTYIIKLSDDERAALQKTIRNKKTCKTVLKRCQILLELDEEQGTGLTHSQIARQMIFYIMGKPADIFHIFRLFHIIIILQAHLTYLKLFFIFDFFYI